MTEAVQASDRPEEGRIHPVRWLATGFAAVFVALGWTAGAVVTAVIFTGTSIAFGWHHGRGRSDEEIAARAAAKAARKAQPPEPAAPPRPAKL
jgi:transposase InsO family protein